MSDDPVRWRDAADPPEGALELVRSLEGPPPLPPPMRASVAARLRRATKPRTRWVGPTTLAVAVVIAGLVIWNFSAPTRRPVEPLSPDVQVLLDEGLAKPSDRGAHAASTDSAADLASATVGAPVDALDAGGADRARTAPVDETSDDAPRPPSEGRPSPHPSRPIRVPVPRPRAADSIGYGTLTVNSMPWAAVRVDGELLGNTPLRNRPLRSGRRHVVLEGNDGRRYETWVDVGAGTHSRIIHQF